MTKQECKRAMQIEIQNNQTDYFGNATLLAETIAIDFNKVEYLNDPAHWIWDIALEVLELNNLDNW